jgi:hypothetical protein
MPYKSAPFHRSSIRKSHYPIPISMTKHIEKGDLVSLIFVNPISMTRHIKKGDLVSLVFVNSISMIRHVEKGNLVFLIFVNPIPKAELNSLMSGKAPEIPECYRNLAHVFSESESIMLPLHRGHLDHHIRLEDGAKPMFGPIYNLSELELKVLKTYLAKKMKMGFIRPSTSPFGSPILFAKKADGSLHLYVDYCMLNHITVKNQYPLPLIMEIIDYIKGAMEFTQLDIRDAFNYLRIAESDEAKIIFYIRYDYYEYLVMPFGFCNAPAMFQAYINNTLHDYLDEFCIAYMDDVLIYTKGSYEEYIEQVRKVLQRLQEHELYIKLEKYEFHVQRM